MAEYLATAGQTYLPFLDNIHIDTLPYEPLKEPGLPPLELTQEMKDRGVELSAQSQHFLLFTDSTEDSRSCWTQQGKGIWKRASSGTLPGL